MSKDEPDPPTGGGAESPTEPVSWPRDPLGGLDPRHLLAAGIPSTSGTGKAPIWEPPLPEDLDALLPAYDVTGILGRGGMGAVYRGFHRSLEREVALKVLPPEVAKDPTFAERFRREALAMADLSHENIVAAYDFGLFEMPTGKGEGETTTSYYIAMELIEGTDLSQLIQGGELAEEQTLEILLQVCEALCYAHEEGYLHRDIKPANIFVDRSGKVKVGDFGLAKIAGDDPYYQAKSSEQAGLTMTGQAVGTPNYIAPEGLIKGREIDHRADIYALGVMFYEMLTGEIPRGVFKPASKKAGTRRSLDRIITRSLEQEPVDRYQSTVELRRDLRRSKAGKMLGFSEREQALLVTGVLGIALFGLFLLARAESPASTESPGKEAGIAPLPETEFRLPYPQRPGLPLERPNKLGRIVVLPIDPERPGPPLSWGVELESEGLDNIVAIELTAQSDLLALRADGSLRYFQTDPSRDAETSEVLARPVFARSDLARITPSLDHQVDEEGASPSAWFEASPEQRLAAIAACEGMAVGISPEGRLLFDDSVAGRHHRLTFGHIHDAIEVRVGASPNRCFVLREGGRWAWGLRDDDGAGHWFRSGENCAVPFHIPRGYLDTEGRVQTHSDFEWALGYHFADSGPYVDEIGGADRAYCIALKRADDSVRLFYRSRDPDYLSHLEPAIHGAIRLLSFIEPGHSSKDPTHLIALLPSESTPRSGYWYSDALRRARFGD